MNKLANIGMMFLVGVVVTMSGCGKQTTPANSAPLVKTIVIGEEISENKHSFSGTVILKPPYRFKSEDVL